MSPETPWYELPEKVQELARNPFNLRLVLQTYSARPVPNVGEGKLQRAFAHEKAIAEQAKADMLFLLLDRISELRRNEISLEELLYGRADTTRKRPSKKAVEKAALIEAAVFDPRPDGPYRQLIEDGLIEERVVGKGENTEERVAFVQEKVVSLMYGELRRRDLRTLKRGALYCAVLFVVFFVGYVALTPGPEERIVPIGQSLAATSLDAEARAALFERVSEPLRLSHHRQMVLPALFLLGVFALLVVGGIGWISAKIDSARRVPLDLTARFRKELLREAQGRYGAYLALPVVLVLMIGVPLWAMNRPKGQSVVDGLASMQWVLLAFVAVVFGIEFVSGAIAVLRNGGVSSDAELIFGWQEAKRDGWMNLMLLPIIVAVFALWHAMPRFIEVGNHRAVVAAVESARHDPALRTLAVSSLEGDRRAFAAINGLIARFDGDRIDADEFAAALGWWVQRVMVLTAILMGLIIPFRLGAGWLLTRWLEARPG
jgi:hypothetical protein